MIISIFLFFYLISIFLTAYCQIFGRIDISVFSLIGALILFLGGLFFLKIKPQSFIIIQKEPLKLSKFSIFISCLLILWLPYILIRYGMSPALYKFLGKEIPSKLLYGNYRNILPRAFIPSIVLVNAVAICSVNTKKNLILFSKFFAFGVLILYTFIYETRYILLWFFIYMFFMNFCNISDLISFFKSKKKSTFIFYVASFIVIWLVFVVAGNIRTGIAFKDAKIFALAMQIDPKWAYLPMPIIWGIIYLFSGVARGLINTDNIPLINVLVPHSFFPGPLQFLTSSENIILKDRFSKQAFAIDAWHTLALSYGVIIAVLIVFLQFFILAYIVFLINKGLTNKANISSGIFAVLLWMLVRIFLFQIGDYFLDFAGFFELVCLCLFFNIGGFQIIKKPN